MVNTESKSTFASSGWNRLSNINWASKLTITIYSRQVTIRLEIASIINCINSGTFKLFRRQWMNFTFKHCSGNTFT